MAHQSRGDGGVHARFIGGIRSARGPGTLGKLPRKMTHENHTSLSCAILFHRHHSQEGNKAQKGPPAVCASPTCNQRLCWKSPSRSTAAMAGRRLVPAPSTGRLFFRVQPAGHPLFSSRTCSWRRIVAARALVTAIAITPLVALATEQLQG